MKLEKNKKNDRKIYVLTLLLRKIFGLIILKEITEPEGIVKSNSYTDIEDLMQSFNQIMNDLSGTSCFIIILDQKEVHLSQSHVIRISSGGVLVTCSKNQKNCSLVIDEEGELFILRGQINFSGINLRITKTLHSSRNFLSLFGADAEFEGSENGFALIKDDSISFFFDDGQRERTDKISSVSKLNGIFMNQANKFFFALENGDVLSLENKYFEIKNHKSGQLIKEFRLNVLETYGQIIGLNKLNIEISDAICQDLEPDDCPFRSIIEQNLHLKNLTLNKDNVYKYSSPVIFGKTIISRETENFEFFESSFFLISSTYLTGTPAFSVFLIFSFPELAIYKQGFVNLLPSKD